MVTHRNILLVDDETTVLNVAKLWLTEAGYQVRCTADGREAITAIEDERPDIMVVDWKMPNIDGIELCGWVRAQEFSNDVYILFLTARTEVDAVVEALSAGADDFLSKPVLREELVSRVHLASRRLATSTQAGTLPHELGRP